MNQNRKKIVLFLMLIIAVVFFFSICYADQPFNYQSKAEELYKDRIVKWTDKLGHYKKLYLTQLFLVAMISISGIVIVAVYDKKFKYKKFTMIFLSLVCVSIFQVFLNLFFHGDHRLLSKIITKYDHQIENFTVAWKNKPIKNRVEMEDFRKYIAEIASRLHEYDDLYYQSSDNNLITSSLHRVSLLTNSYANELVRPDKHNFQATATSDSYSNAMKKAKYQSVKNLYNYLIDIVDISYKEKDFLSFNNEIQSIIKFNITNIPDKNFFKVQAKIIIYKDVLTTFLEYYFFKQARLIEQKKSNAKSFELKKYYNAVLYFSENNEEAKIYLKNLQHNELNLNNNSIIQISNNREELLKHTNDIYKLIEEVQFQANSNPEGLKIIYMKQNSLFEKLGFKIKDIWHEIDGKKVNIIENYLLLFEAIKSQATFSLVITRNHNKIEILNTLN